MEPVTSARFEFTQEDYVGFNLYHHQHSPTSRRIQRLFSVCFLTIAVAVVALKLFGPPISDLVWAIPVGVVIAVLLVPSRFRRHLRKTILSMLEEGRNKGLLGAKEITMTPTEIRETGAMGVTTTAWPAVERIVVDGAALYIYINSISAVVVPRRAFAQDSDFQSFTDTARRYYAEAAARAK